MTQATFTQDNVTVWYDATLMATFEPRLFDLPWLREHGHLMGASTGRNQAWFIHHGGLDLVWRHFWRGGLVGRVNPDLYVRTRPDQSRAMQEYQLLDWMGGQGLPVPRPVVARVQTAGLFYRADLITQRIPDATTLAAHLMDAPLGPADWQQIGAEIARMHGVGVCHSDLNCRNILRDGEGKIWLIDFDKSNRRPPGPWAEKNLARLHRSLEKEKTKVPGLHWGGDDWRALLAGYGAK